MNPGDKASWGTAVNDEALRYSLTKSLRAAAERLQYFTIEGMLQGITLGDECVEMLLLEVQPEIPQKVVCDIRNREPIALVILDNSVIPEVWALRQDFPPVPHINLREYDWPKSLCVYENPEEDRLRLAPGRFLEDIRSWFSRTAVGSLHQENQPLEPFAQTSNPRLIIPREVIESAAKNGFCDVTMREIDNSIGASALVHEPSAKKGHNRLFRFLYLRTPEHTHGIINREPKNFGFLRSLLLRDGIDVLSVVREALGGILGIEPQDNRPIVLVLLVQIPRRRHPDSDMEDIETWAFRFKPDIKQLGCHLGIWRIQEGELGTLVPLDLSKVGDDIEIESLNTCLPFDSQVARRTSGLVGFPDRKIVLVGCGSLGSQVFMNMARMGIGKWILVDNDIVLPHNFARHAAFPGLEGMNKAEVMELVSDGILDRGSVSFINAHVGSLEGAPSAIVESFEEADIVIDASTSISVSRSLSAKTNAQARKASIFLNPRGTDAVLLLEDKNRFAPLDSLEMQYYRLILENASLHTHLLKPQGTIRYSNSCRDFSSILPQSHIATFAGILSGSLIKWFQEDEGKIVIWRLDPQEWSISKTEVKSYNDRVMQVGAWTLKIDEGFLSKIFCFRASRLPTETGGVLLGAFDVIRKIIYVVDTIPSPKDSIEQVTSFIRGKEGLEAQLKSVNAISSGQLDYIGEWHSHPEGTSSDPSIFDYEQLFWIDENMRRFGLPGVMVIPADGTEVSLLLIEAGAQNISEVATVKQIMR